MDVFTVSKGVHRAWWLWVKFWEWDCSISPLLLLDTQSRASHFNRWASVFLCKNGFNGSTYLTGLWQGCNEMCNVLGTESSMRQAPGTCQLSRLLCYPEYWGSFSHPPWQIPYAPACSRLWILTPWILKLTALADLGSVFPPGISHYPNISLPEHCRSFHWLNRSGFWNACA